MKAITAHTKKEKEISESWYTWKWPRIQKPWLLSLLWSQFVIYNEKWGEIQTYFLTQLGNLVSPFILSHCIQRWLMRVLRAEILYSQLSWWVEKTETVIRIKKINKIITKWCSHTHYSNFTSKYLIVMTASATGMN